MADKAPAPKLKKITQTLVIDPKEIMPDIFIGSPNSKPWSSEYLKSLLFCEKPPDGNFVWNHVPNQAISIARNLLCERFLSTPCNVLILIDNDASWGEQTITREYNRIINDGVRMVSPIIFKRSLPCYPTMGKHTGKDIHDNHVYNFSHVMKAIVERCKEEGADLTVEDEVLFPKRDHDLMEVDGVGGHFMVIHREVLEAIKPPYFMNTSLNAGEDFYFCRKVRKAGFKIYADLSAYTGHVVGEGFVYGLREFLAFYEYAADMRISIKDFAV